jgi:sugar diacid utilization regulator
MELEQIRTKLEAILGKKVAIESNVGVGVGGETKGRTVFESGSFEVVIYGDLTNAERELVALLFESGRVYSKPQNISTDEERQSALLAAWVLERIEKGDTESPLPEPLSMWPAISGVKVPLLLYGDYPDRQQQTSYSELRKLLKTFFEDDIVLIPLHNKQWLILGDESLVAKVKDNDGETMEESLSELASALHDMAASEWVGECHVAATYPFTPSTSLVQAVLTLRETIELGRAYRMSSNIHLPWELRLETLLDAAPKRSKARFLEGVLRRAEPSFESEMLQTLDTFFLENCNVSDTAKRLYIHRNTLLYRLDKFKQETDMDVRDFDHAVLVRLALLLYKVTKRK